VTVPGHDGDLVLLVEAVARIALGERLLDQLRELGGVGRAILGRVCHGHAFLIT
jgi:hypothetical protein